MSKSRYINTKFWSDNFVVDKLNALDRYLFLYLLTNEHTNLLGIYELPIRTAAFETGIDQHDLEKMLKRLSPKVEFFDGWVYIAKFIDNQQRNPSVDKGIMREIFYLPDAVIDQVLAFGTPSERLTAAFSKLSQPDTHSDSVEQSVHSLSHSANSKRQSVHKVSVTKPVLVPTVLTHTKPNGKGTDVPFVPPAAPSPRPGTITRSDLLKKLNTTLHGSTPLTITKGRLDKLSARLKTFTAQQLVTAAEVVGNDGYLQGDNDKGKRWGDIDYLLRSDEMVAKHLEASDGTGGANDAQEALRNVRI